MTNDEAKAAWRNQTPVALDGISYTISALIYRLPHSLTVELLDKTGRCVVIVPPDKIQKGENSNGKS